MLCLRKSLSVKATATFLRTAQPRDTASSTQAALKPHLGFVPSNASNKLKPRNTGKPHETCPQQNRRLSNRKSAHDLGQKRPRSWSSQTSPESPSTLPISRIRIQLKTTKQPADQNRRKTILHNVRVHIHGEQGKSLHFACASDPARESVLYATPCSAYFMSERLNLI